MRMDERQERNVKGEILVNGLNRVEWNIPEFFSLPEEESYSFESPHFRYRDGTWCFQCCPNRLKFGRMSLSLKSVSCPSECILRFEMGIVMELRKFPFCGNMEIVSRKRKIGYFRDGESRGILLFVERSYLQRNTCFFRSPNELRFFCIFNTNTEDASSQDGGASEYTEENAVNFIQKDGDDTKLEFTSKLGVNSLVQNLKDLLLKKEQSDILVKVKDKEFKAHKAILGGRSNVFSEMFAHDTVEKKTNIVEITDCEPNAFEQFLMYLYTGQVERVPGDQVIDLYFIADIYNVEELKEECVNFMKDHMTVETFCDVMSLALSHSEMALIESAAKYFAENVKKIIVTAKWITFVKENPVECNELHIKSLKYGNKN